MFKDFDYADNEGNETVHYMTFGTEDNKNYLIGINELFADIE